MIEVEKINNLKYEQALYDQGIKLIAGVDEVGRGPLIGPVVASAVILPVNYQLDGLTDSKKLSEKKREAFYDIIRRDAISIGIGIIDHEIIDKVNIYQASKLAMIAAINDLKVTPEHILSDAMKLDINIPVTAIIKGDLLSISISAASIIAKVTRDKMMLKLHDQYPIYQFNKNKGYPTKKHLEAIKKYGILKDHRKTYGPIADYINKTS